MINRMVGAGVVLAVLVCGAAACSSSSHKTKAKPTSTTSAASTTTTTTKTTTTTAPVATTTIAPPAPSPTTGIAPPPDAETAAKRFFAAWLAHDAAGLNANGTAAAIGQATAQYAKTAGATWQFSNCQGAAGSEYCTWVRAAEDAIVRASSVSPANRTVEFQYHALEALDIADQFLNAWEFDSSGALGALGTSDAVNQIQSLATHRNDGWQSPGSCEGTAGSFYCTFTAGAHKLIVHVGDVQIPHQAIGVTYS